MIIIIELKIIFKLKFTKIYPTMCERHYTDTYPRALLVGGGQIRLKT